MQMVISLGRNKKELLKSQKMARKTFLDKKENENFPTNDIVMIN